MRSMGEGERLSRWGYQLRSMQAGQEPNVVAQ